MPPNDNRNLVLFGLNAQEQTEQVSMMHTSTIVARVLCTRLIWLPEIFC